ncbi:MAG: DnaJ domain-containing protein [bacterium]|nr:DnaJ domain-containing protein [bacterium]
MRFPGFNLYKEMGVPQGASNDEIKRTYRQLVKKYHPDVNNTVDGEERFKRISTAYEILGNSEKRSAYDSFLIMSGGVSPNYSPRTTQSRPMPFSFNLEELEELLEKMCRDKFGDNWREELKKQGVDPEDIPREPRTSSSRTSTDEPTANRTAYRSGFPRSKATPSKVKYYRYPRVSMPPGLYLIAVALILLYLYQS